MLICTSFDQNKKYAKKHFDADDENDKIMYFSDLVAGWLNGLPKHQRASQRVRRGGGGEGEALERIVDRLGRMNRPPTDKQLAKSQDGWCYCAAGMLGMPTLSNQHR